MPLVEGLNDAMGETNSIETRLAEHGCQLLSPGLMLCNSFNFVLLMNRSPSIASRLDLPSEIGLRLLGGLLATVG